MRLTPVRAALARARPAGPADALAFAQDHSPAAPRAHQPSEQHRQRRPSGAPGQRRPRRPTPVRRSRRPTAARPDQASRQASAHAAEIYTDLDFFGQVFDRIRSEYVDPPDEQALIRAAINGMLTSLDPHSSYLDPPSSIRPQQDTSGQFGGLGIEVTMEEGVIKVISPIDDTPAAKAGILANDYIVELDGKSVQGIALDDAVAKMMPARSAPRSSSPCMREGQQKPLYFELTRDTIAQRAVNWSMEGDVAVLRLASFTEQAFPGIQKAINDIYDQSKGVAPKGIILDLRNNPGGLVDQAVYVSDAFLKQGAIVLTRGRTDQESRRATTPSPTPSTPSSPGCRWSC